MASKLKKTVKKRIIPAVLAAAMVLSLCPAVIFTAFAETSDDGLWEYTVSGTDAAITKYNGSATEVTIPEKIDEYTVTSIYGIYVGASYTAVFGENVTSVTIPGSVKSIGGYAFKGCTGLTSVTIPDSVMSIRMEAFASCTGLTSISIGISVTSIDGYAFSGCTGLTSVTIPDSVTSIGDSAFRGCTGLRSVTIPNSVTYIDYSAFRGCTSLTSITIPNSVNSIGDDAFSGCTGLTNIIAPYWLPGLDKTQEVSFTVSDGVTSIGDNAFEGCAGLTSISISNSVTSISNGAFEGCTGLTNITAPYWLPGLDKKQEVSFTVSDGVTSIGNYTFRGCTGLTSVTIPNSVASIGESAFSSCTGLKSIKIPNSVTSIDSSAFNGCTGLESITVDENNPQYSSIDGVIYNNDKTELICYPEGKTYTSFIIPNSVTSIGYGAFAGHTGLTNITIPNSVTSIASYAFSGCTGLTSITIPNSVTSIASYAFSGCTGLTDITAPKWLSGLDKTQKVSFTVSDGVTSIGGWEFYGCTGLTSVTIGNSVTSIDDYAFRDCTGLTSVTIGNSVTSIAGYAFSGCTGLTSITIPNSVTSIGYYAFSGCTGLTSVTIPNSVTSIGYYAFRDCTGLTSVTIPSSVNSIGDGAFSSCTGLTNITAPYWLPGLDKMQKVSFTVSDGVTSIGWGAFYDCTGLTSITIPDSVTRIVNDAFYGCDNLKTVYINGSKNPYGDIFGSAKIEFVPNKIEITEMPSKIIYTVGETFDKTGIVITASYSDGKSKTVTDYILSGFDSATVGEKTVTVTYGGKSVSFKVEVIRSLVGISVEQGKVLYAVGETIDKADITVTANYDDGSSDTLSAEYYTITAPDMSSVGNKTVMVSCNGKTAYFTVKVRNAFTQKDNFENKGTVDTSVGIISANAFDDTITEITIGDNVQQIADDAFTFTSGKPVIIRGYKNSAVQKFAEKMGTDKVQFEELAQPKKGLIVNPLNPDPAAQPEMRDALAMFKGIVYDETDTFFCKAAADMDDSGDINLVDCLVLLLKLKNSPPKTEPEQTA